MRAIDPAAHVEQSLPPSHSATVVVVAYRMSTISLADEVVHLERGRVVDRGTHVDLLGRDAGYRHLVTAYARQAQERAAREVTP